jgi:ubiquinone/menaquinone biosynthesis C-methylase UbiE
VVDWASSIKSFDRVAGIYDATRGIPPGEAATIAGGIADLLGEVPGAGRKRALEVGVGTGRIAVPLAAAGVDVVGFDVSRLMLEQLVRKRPRVGALLAEATRPPFRQRSFEAALFVHVLHLLPDPEAALRATLPLVRPGGLLMHSRSGGRRPGDPRTEVDAAIFEAIERSAGERASAEGRHARGREAFDRVLGEAGASFETVSLAGWTETVTPGELVREVAERVHSMSWAVSDAELPRAVENVGRRLERRFGPPGTPIEVPVEFMLQVARLPIP